MRYITLMSSIEDVAHVGRALVFQTKGRGIVALHPLFYNKPNNKPNNNSTSSQTGTGTNPFLGTCARIYLFSGEDYGSKI